MRVYEKHSYTRRIFAMRQSDKQNYQAINGDFNKLSVVSPLELETRQM